MRTTNKTHVLNEKYGLGKLAVVGIERTMSTSSPPRSASRPEPVGHTFEPEETTKVWEALAEAPIHESATDALRIN